MCDFSPEHGLCSSQCSRKKTGRPAILLGVSREPRPRPISVWVADLFCFKIRGAGRGDFFTLVRVSSQKAEQCQKIFPVG